MKYALVVTGVLAGLAMGAPQLVVLGYFLLIIPGLILTVAPTVFFYLAGTAVIRKLLPFSSVSAATPVAFCVTLLLGWLVMQPFQYSAGKTYRASLQPDVIPNKPIELNGHVRIERPENRNAADCDYLCLAVLDSPSVESVTNVTAGKNPKPPAIKLAAYELVPANNNPAAGIFPHEPGQIVREYPPLVQLRRGSKFMTAAKAVEADWAIRLSGQERLRQTAPVEAMTADWIIRIESQTNRQNGKLRRVTVLHADGTVRFRRSYRKQAIPAGMFYFGFHTAGMTSPGWFDIGQTILENGEQSLQPESALLEAIKFSVPACDANALLVLRKKVYETLDNPAATPAQLDMLRNYLGLFFFDATPRDHQLIAQIVADDRVKDIDQQIKNVISKKKTPAAMRVAYAKRILMDHTSADLRHWLAEGLACLPPGTYATPSAEHLAIWDMPEIYQDAAPFVARVADLGAERAMPRLNAMLATAIGLSEWRARRPLVDGVRAAMIRLGPQASAAAPQIRELFLRRPSPIMNNAGDADDWRFALVRMGVEIEELPVFPHQSPKTAERISRRLAEKVRRYNQENAQEPQA
jgi:hypothetical protein